MNEFSMVLKGKSGPDAVLTVWRTGATNLGYLLQAECSKKAVAIDVTDGEQLLEQLWKRGVSLGTILQTHFHHDHVRGLEDVIGQTGCTYVAPAPFEDLPRLHVSEGMTWSVEGLEVLAFETSGHSPLDFSYRFSDLELCFCGDTLFGWGCGRVFAGPPETFWASLERLRALPPETRLCTGHDFREDNLLFMKEQLPNLPWVEEGIQQMEKELEAGTFPEPLLLSDQLRTNAFLRADDPDLAKGIGRAGASPAEVFAELRTRRNQY